MKGSPTNPVWERGSNGEKWICVSQEDGSLISDPSTFDGAVTWRQFADPLELSIQLVGSKRTYRSYQFLWRDIVTGAVHPMFMKEFISLLQDGHITGIMLVGKFDIVKRGRYYGIKFIGN